MRQVIQELYVKFAGSDVFIVGGGNSLKNFDFNLLKKKNVIVINSAYQHVDSAEAVLYWADASWGANHEDKGLRSHPSKYKFTSRINADAQILKNTTGVAGSHFLKKTGDMGYDPNVDNVRGNNSGAQAINFAVNLNAARIILLGFDMGYVSGRTHFHDDNPTAVAQSVYKDLFIPSINSMAKEFAYRPVEVINCSYSSNLKCFKIGDIKDYL